MYKARIEPNLWCCDPHGYRIPVELSMYRANNNPRLPFYIQDFEDEDFFYIVTALHGVKKEKSSLFGNRFHDFDWVEHLKVGTKTKAT